MATPRRGTIKGQIRFQSSASPMALINQVNANKELREAIADFLLDEAEYFQVNSPKGATWGLASGWDIIPPRRSATSLALEWAIINEDQKANFKIAGRGPGGMPPREPILAYVLAMGGDPRQVYPMQKAIALRGTRRWRSRTNWVGINNDGSIISGGRVDTMDERMVSYIKQRLARR